MKIVIAAQTGTNRKFIRRYLEFAGFRGCRFYEAWHFYDIAERAGEESVDLVFIDLDWQSLDIASVMEKMSSKSKVVALTPHISKAKREYFLNHGISVVITKPLSADKIRTSLMESSLSTTIKGISQNPNQLSPLPFFVK